MANSKDARFKNFGALPNVDHSNSHPPTDLSLNSRSSFQSQAQGAVKNAIAWSLRCSLQYCFYASIKSTGHHIPCQTRPSELVNQEALACSYIAVKPSSIALTTTLLAGCDTRLRSWQSRTGNLPDCNIRRQLLDFPVISRHWKPASSHTLLRSHAAFDSGVKLPRGLDNAGQG